ncbi:MAG TPA: hypothetical protein VH349_12365 [Ktedonobacterales bacterium]|jgi:hypothetical protein
MASFQAQGPQTADSATSSAPLVIVYERDDSIAVPLLSQVRIAGYDVRAARTPVELFDTLSKQQASVVLVDLGNATAGRREFWVALDALRHGRTLEVMTFRIAEPADDLDLDFDASAQALADVEIAGKQDFGAVIEAMRQRVPPQSASASGAALPVMPDMNRRVDQALGAMASMAPFGRPSAGPGDASPFARPMDANPFAAPAFSPADSSPFAQPFASNPFASEISATSDPFGGSLGGGFGGSSQWLNSDPGASSFGSNLGSNPGVGASFPGLSNPGDGFYKPGGAFDPTAQQSGSRQPQPPASFSPASPASSSSPNQPSQSGVRPSIADVWTPPDAGAREPEPETGIMPEAAFPLGAFGASPANNLSAGDAASRWGAQASAGGFGAPAPESVPLSPNEKALSDVLVEGALLSRQTLDMLKGVRKMLRAQNMQVNIGELAMMFKFLTPDQLLAALLVSRELVSPQQIATLGRKKQELAEQGRDIDLEKLLEMYHIVPREQLDEIRAEMRHR